MTDPAVFKHLSSAGKKGGGANTPEQQAARKRNMYKALLKRFPTSAVIKRKLKVLEQEQNG